MNTIQFLTDFAREYENVGLAAEASMLQFVLNSLKNENTEAAIQFIEKRKGICRDSIQNSSHSTVLAVAGRNLAMLNMLQKMVESEETND